MQKKIVKITGYTYARISLTNFEYEARAMTGNGNNFDKFVKSLRVNLFLANLSHLKPLCLTLIAWPTLTTVSLTL